MTSPAARLRALAPSAASLLLAVYLLSPIALQPWLGGGIGWTDTLFLYNAAMSVLWLALANALTRRPLALHAALMGLYVATAVDLFLLWVFRSRLSSGYITIALTDHVEIDEFVASYGRPVLVSVIVLLAVYLPGLYAIRHEVRERSLRVAAAAAVLLAALYGGPMLRNMWLGNDGRTSILDIVAKDQSAPIGFLSQAGLAVHLHLQTTELRHQRAAHSFGARVDTATKGQTLVYVIGESSRPKNWSVYGYGRQTNPKLGSVTGLILFPNMLTTAPLTSYAVPSMMSLEPITDWSSILAKKSIVSAFREAGFRTYWLSAQSADSWGGIVPQMAAEAARRRYFEPSFDGDLLDGLRTVLGDAKPDDSLFVVLHTKGSHFEYARRYPNEFKRFSSPGSGREAELVDAYDNSVLYTDWVLSEVINTLSRRGGLSALVYASDHGENLLDDQRQLFGHGIGNEFDLPTAAFMWLSDELQRGEPTKMAALRRNAVEPLSLSDLPHSLVDLAGIQTRDFVPNRSLLSDAFVPTRPRWYIVRGDLLHETAKADRP